MLSQAKVYVAQLGEIPVGAARLVRLKADKFGRPRSAIVLCDATETLHAYLNECRHLPIPLDAGSGQVWNIERTHLLCSTHGAMYRPDDGLCVAGPCAGASLLRLDVAIEGADVFVVDDDTL
jgi:nitrite reductase/ring-hydroxylating ferredoxin subunit